MLSSRRLGFVAFADGGAGPPKINTRLAVSPPSPTTLDEAQELRAAGPSHVSPRHSSWRRPASSTPFAFLVTHCSELIPHAVTPLPPTKRRL
ncbi:hypothetical protein MRX96_002163 [Rhipicephalus microplus]